MIKIHKTYISNFLSGRMFRVFLSFLLLTVGGAIYILYRQDSLLMFKCFEELGIAETIQYLRTTGTEHSLFDWVKNSLPDGLWLFSYMFLIDTIWNGDKPFSYYFFLWLLPFIAISSEVLQIFGIVPGVYDTIDMLCYSVAILVFLILKFIIK